MYVNDEHSGEQTTKSISFTVAQRSTWINAPYESGLSISFTERSAAQEHRLRVGAMYCMQINLIDHQRATVLGVLEFLEDLLVLEVVIRSEPEHVSVALSKSARRARAVRFVNTCRGAGDSP